MGNGIIGLVDVGLTEETAALLRAWHAKNSKFHRFVAAFFSRALRTFSGPYSACRGFLDRPLEFCGSFLGERVFAVWFRSDRSVF